MIEEKLNYMYDKESDNYYIFVNPKKVNPALTNLKTKILLEVPSHSLRPLAEATEYYNDTSVFGQGKIRHIGSFDKDDYEMAPIAGVVCTIWAEPNRDMLYVKIQKRTSDSKYGLLFRLTEEMLIYADPPLDHYIVYCMPEKETN